MVCDAPRHLVGRREIGVGEKNVQEATASARPAATPRHRVFSNVRSHRVRESVMLVE
jgi:hypothetical protein